MKGGKYLNIISIFIIIISIILILPILHLSDALVVQYSSLHFTTAPDTDNRHYIYFSTSFVGNPGRYNVYTNNSVEHFQCHYYIISSDNTNYIGQFTGTDIPSMEIFTSLETIQLLCRFSTITSPFLYFYIKEYGTDDNIIHQFTIYVHYVQIHYKFDDRRDLITLQPKNYSQSTSTYQHSWTLYLDTLLKHSSEPLPIDRIEIMLIGPGYFRNTGTDISITCQWGLDTLYYTGASLDRSTSYGMTSIISPVPSGHTLGATKVTCTADIFYISDSSNNPMNIPLYVGVQFYDFQSNQLGGVYGAIDLSHQCLKCIYNDNIDNILSKSLIWIPRSYNIDHTIQYMQCNPFYTYDHQFISISEIYDPISYISSNTLIDGGIIRIHYTGWSLSNDMVYQSKLLHGLYASIHIEFLPPKDAPGYILDLFDQYSMGIIELVSIQNIYSAGFNIASLFNTTHIHNIINNRYSNDIDMINNILMKISQYPIKISCVIYISENTTITPKPPASVVKMSFIPFKYDKSYDITSLTTSFWQPTLSLSESASSSLNIQSNPDLANDINISPLPTLQQAQELIYPAIFATDIKSSSLWSFPMTTPFMDYEYGSSITVVTTSPLELNIDITHSIPPVSSDDDLPIYGSAYPSILVKFPLSRGIIGKIYDNQSISCNVRIYGTRYSTNNEYIHYGEIYNNNMFIIKPTSLYYSNIKYINIICNNIQYVLPKYTNIVNDEQLIEPLSSLYNIDKPIQYIKSIFKLIFSPYIYNSIYNDLIYIQIKNDNYEYGIMGYTTPPYHSTSLSQATIIIIVVCSIVGAIILFILITCIVVYRRRIKQQQTSGGKGPGVSVQLSPINTTTYVYNPPIYDSPYHAASSPRALPTNIHLLGSSNVTPSSVSDPASSGVHALPHHDLDTSKPHDHQSLPSYDPYAVSQHNSDPPERYSPYSA